MEVGFFMSKSKFSAEQKIQACREYISGEKSATQIANELNLGKQGKIRVRTWARIYQVQGEKAFSTCKGNRSYSREFKIMVVNEYLSGKSSLRDLMVKYNIPANTTIQRWIMKYNNHILQELQNIFGSSEDSVIVQKEILRIMQEQNPDESLLKEKGIDVIIQMFFMSLQIYLANKGIIN